MSFSFCVMIISPLRTMYVVVVVVVVVVILFFCKDKKSGKRVSDKTAPKWRKGREGTFGGWAGAFS